MTIEMPEIKKHRRKTTRAWRGGSIQVVNGKRASWIEKFTELIRFVATGSKLGITPLSI